MRVLVVLVLVLREEEILLVLERLASLAWPAAVHLPIPQGKDDDIRQIDVNSGKYQITTVADVPRLQQLVGDYYEGVAIGYAGLWSGKSASSAS